MPLIRKAFNLILPALTLATLAGTLTVTLGNFVAEAATEGIITTGSAVLFPHRAFKELNETKNMAYEIGFKKVDRVEILENFFEKYNSPLKGSSATFVEVADRYGIDYKLLPAISCMESTCGRFLIEGTYNPFGWGIYGDNFIAFENYDEAIRTVGEGLHAGYFSKGLNTPAKIAPVYTPPNSYNWYKGVTWFTNEIDKVIVES